MRNRCLLWPTFCTFQTPLTVLTNSALIYLTGFRLQDLVAILDFLYCGKASVFQENLDSFLAIAEELKLKGLAIQSPSDVLKKEETPSSPKSFNNSCIRNDLVQDVNTVE